MGVGGELSGAVYQAASLLNQIPDTPTKARCSPRTRICAGSLAVSNWLTLAVVLVFLKDRCARSLFFSFPFSMITTKGELGDVVPQQIKAIYDSWELPGHHLTPPGETLEASDGRRDRPTRHTCQHPRDRTWSTAPQCRNCLIDWQLGCGKLLSAEQNNRYKTPWKRLSENNAYPTGQTKPSGATGGIRSFF